MRKKMFCGQGAKRGLSILLSGALIMASMSLPQFGQTLYASELTTTSSEGVSLVNNEGTEKTDPTYTAPTAKAGLFCDGTEKELINAGSTEDGTFQYSLEKEGTYTADIPKATDIGSYEVYYKIIGDDEHEDKTFDEPISVSISAATSSNQITLNQETLAALTKNYGTDSYAMKFSNGVKLVLEGKVELDAQKEYGIYSGGQLTISGTGELDISNVTMSGIYSSGNFTLNSGKIVVTGYPTYGISCGSNYIYLNGGSVDLQTSRFGLQAYRSIFVENTNVKIVGNSSASSRGLYGGVTVGISPNSDVEISGFTDGIYAQCFVVYECASGKTPCELTISSCDYGIDVIDFDNSCKINSGNITISANKYAYYANYDQITTQIQAGEISLYGEEGAICAPGQLTIVPSFEVGSDAANAYAADNYGGQKYIHISTSGDVNTDRKTTSIGIDGTVTQDSASGQGWEYDASTKTLTLTDYEGTTNCTENAKTMQLYIDGDVNLVLSGSSKLESTADYGLYCTGSLTVSGEGSLSVKNVVNGIYTAGKLSFEGGNVAISSSSDSVTLPGLLEMKTGSLTTDNTIHTETWPQIDIRGGSIEAPYIEAVNINISGGTVEARLHTSRNIKISGGTVTAEAENDFAIEAEDSMTISGGTVNASCSGTGTSNVAIMTAEPILSGTLQLTITGGVVNASSGYLAAYTYGQTKIMGGTFNCRGKYAFRGYGLTTISGGHTKWTGTEKAVLSGNLSIGSNVVLMGGESEEAATQKAYDSADKYISVSPTPYTLTYDVNGGDTLSQTTKVIYVNEAYGELATPTRTGYFFAGWFTAAEDGTQVTEETVCSGDAVIYAHWTSCPHEAGIRTENQVNATCTTDGYSGDIYCIACGEKITTGTVIPAIGHDYGPVTYTWSEDMETCTASRTCANDSSHVETEVATVSSEVTSPETCTEMGTVAYTASFENAAFETQTKEVEEIEASGHDYGPVTYIWSKDGKACAAVRVCRNDFTHIEMETVTSTASLKNPATCTKKGVTSYTASFENPAFETQTKEIEDICSPETIALSKSSFTYNGKVQKPTVTVKDTAGQVISSKNYKLTYSGGCKSVGTYTLKITFIGNYSGTVSKTFTIVPKGTSISKVSASSKGFTVTWGKQATETSGYMIQYSLNSNFSNAKSDIITKNSTVSKAYSKLSGGKKYYVRVCTYKTVGGKKICSSWSAAKSVTTKK